ncbi:PREDICTED: meiotic nuclear division protein 1 homolog [Priapulus caudatus]|uniref:Meiotic nuclear division protein 1 homolog n=1 Tax=Priapulus caudatus TaxID=37621 RepID=A0ABM1EZ25_PRICU|nr:PREDICTED: meiotic nuclear division protein 1 homolog [Priapulus caudatus]
MMEIFFEKKDCFQLKELEKIGPKEKGITSMSVKEVVQSLVDDGMVDSEKIGTSVYFWAFPSKALNNRKRKMDEITSKLEDTERKKKVCEMTLSESRVGREDSEKRTKSLKSLAERGGERDQLHADLERHRECDPEVLEETKQQIIVSKEAANRWTDNIFSLKTWAKKKFGLEESVLNKQFEIPEDLDYLN